MQAEVKSLSYVLFVSAHNTQTYQTGLNIIVIYQLSQYIIIYRYWIRQFPIILVFIPTHQYITYSAIKSNIIVYNIYYIE